MPWWGAVVIALTFTAVGFAFDAGSGTRELSAVFAASYIVGCVAAVLAVRQNGVFTAVIQPPIVLFFTVPGAYFLMHRGQLDGLRDLAINCGYPLVERFPLMFFTSAGVLLIGLVRWYFGMSAQHAAPAAEGASPAPATALAGLLGSVKEKLSALVAGGGGARTGETTPRRRAARNSARTAASSRRRTGETSSGARTRRRSSTAASARDTAAGTTRRGGTRRAAAEGADPARSRRSTRRADTPRSRHTRPPEAEPVESFTERPRRSRRTTEPPATPPRRSRAAAPREPRPQPGTEWRPGYPDHQADYPGYGTGYGRGTDGYGGYDRPRRRPRYDDYEPLEPHRNGSDGYGGFRESHHPVSRVRYRGTDDTDLRAERRPRPSAGRHAVDADIDSWQYDR